MRARKQAVGALASAVAIAMPLALAQLPEPVPPVAPAPPAAERPPTPEPTPEEIAAAIEELKSDDFQRREAAMSKIWSFGRAAEGPLRKAIESGDAEMRYRGGKILEEFELGIYPDTPEEIRRLVKAYRKGDPRNREAIVQQLAALGQTDLLVRLVKRETDPATRERVARLVAKNVAEAVPAHIAAGEMDKAEGLLRIAALNSYSMRNYAAFLHLTGKLEAAITEQQELADNTPVDAELLAWMLRAGGKIKEATAAFEKLGNERLARECRVAAGDRKAYAECFVDPSKRTADTVSFAAAAARYSGDRERFEAHAADLVEYGKAMPDEADRCLVGLIINTEFERAFELARATDPGEVLDMELWRYDFTAAFKAIGVEPGAAGYEKWLAQFLEKFEFDAAKERGVADAIFPAGQLASAASIVGQRDEAERILRAVGRRLEKDNAELLPLVRWARATDFDELAREYAVKAMELDLESDVVRSLYPLRPDHQWMITRAWNFLRDTYAEDSNAAALLKMSALFDFDNTGAGAGDPAPLFKAMEEKSEKLVGEARRETLHMLADIARLHEDWPTAAKAMGQWLPLLGKEAAAYHYIRYGEALLKADRPAEAAQQYKTAAELSPRDPVPVYSRAVALERAGDAGQANELRRSAQLMALGDVTRRHFLAIAMWGLGDDDLARAEDQFILRMASPLEGVHPEALRRIYLDRNTGSDTLAAAEALESYILTMMRPVNRTSLPSRRRALALMTNLGTMRARIALDAGDNTAALATLRKLQAINPSDSSMLEDAYQMLTAAGKAAEAEALFKTTYKTSKAAVDSFPEKGQHHNNLAWLLSRCAKQLDDALVHAERAVEMEPDNGAFLDTLAEVHFQRGDREKAVAFSEKAVAILGDDAQVLRQLERFKTGKPTDR